MLHHNGNPNCSTNMSPKMIPRGLRTISIGTRVWAAIQSPTFFDLMLLLEEVVNFAKWTGKHDCSVEVSRVDSRKKKSEHYQNHHFTPGSVTVAVTQ